MLGFPLDKVHEEACRLEHFISEEFVEKISSLLGDPKFDPHGHPIPSKEGVISIQEDTPLALVEPGFDYVITRLHDYDPKLLAYLEGMHLVPNTKIKVMEKSPSSEVVETGNDS
jgi:DtxR family Mn-dependent transcriptional regulator